MKNYVFLFSLCFLVYVKGSFHWVVTDPGAHAIFDIG